MITSMNRCKECGDKPVIYRQIGGKVIVRCKCGKAYESNVEGLAVGMWNDANGDVRKPKLYGYKSLCKICPTMKKCQDGELFSDGKCYYRG